MIDHNTDHFLWVEKYRPAKIADCILPDSSKEIAEGFISQGRLPNIILSGGAGMGKTTLAKAMCNEVGADWIIINGSDEGRTIDTLRTKVYNFASTVSFSDAKKVVIIDEADYMNPQSVQPAMREFMERFSNNCTFILTCNYKNRIIEPLHSRCKVLDFKILKSDKPKLATTFFKRVAQILDNEKVEYDKKVIAELINKFFPDFRRCLNELQSYSVSGKIDAGILVNVSEESYNELFKHLKEKKFNDMRKWVADHSDEDTVSIYSTIYSRGMELLDPKSIAPFILTLARYQYQDAFAANKEINTVAFLTELMGEVRWK